MTLPTGQISMSQVNVEIGQAAGAQLGLSNGTVRNIAGAPGQISMSQLQGKSNLSFNPPPGNIFKVGARNASATINATRDVTWYHNGIVSSTNGANRGSGTSGSSITFTLVARTSGSVFVNDRAVYNCRAVGPDNTNYYWTIDLEVGTQ